jgi:hypothetical protein
LLANAVKYSAKKENPVVQIGSLKKCQRVTYFVKDTMEQDLAWIMPIGSLVFFSGLDKETEFEGKWQAKSIINYKYRNESNVMFLIFSEAFLNN